MRKVTTAESWSQEWVVLGINLPHARRLLLSVYVRNCVWVWSCGYRSPRMLSSAELDCHSGGRREGQNAEGKVESRAYEVSEPGGTQE